MSEQVNMARAPDKRPQFSQKAISFAWLLFALLYGTQAP
jgi:hypothetical protein